MRLVIEVSESERDALRKLCVSLDGAAYSALVRAWLRLSLDGGIPRKALVAALSAPRAVLNVTLAQEPKPAKEEAKPAHGLAGWDKRPPRRS